MNIYVITEGLESEVYKSWIPLVNPDLTLANHIGEVKSNNFFVVSAQGYPDYFNTIEAAISDINSLKIFDRLVISVDSEDGSKAAKFNELSQFVSNKGCITEIRIVIQHFCFETWALGNRKIVGRNLTSHLLRKYKQLYDVTKLDPEQLPPNREENLNRARFAKKYLRLALTNKFQTLTYRENNPKALLNEKYFYQLKLRFEQTGHISSFGDFLNAFV